MWRRVMQRRASASDEIAHEGETKMNRKKVSKYSYYIILPLLLAVMLFIGYLIGLSASNHAHADRAESWQTSFQFTSDEPDWR